MGIRLYVNMVFTHPGNLAEYFGWLCMKYSDPKTSQELIIAPNVNASIWCGWLSIHEYIGLASLPIPLKIPLTVMILSNATQQYVVKLSDTHVSFI
jgi:hypothetical protein